MAEENQETTEKETNKLNSRKFIVFIILTIFCAAAVVFGGIVKDTSLITKALDTMLLNAGFYVGGNCFSKWVNTKET